MSVIFNQGYERTKRIRLPEGQTNLNPKDPVQASAIGNVIRTVRNATGLEDVGAVLSLVGAVNVVDPNANVAKTVVGKEEIYHMSNGKQTMKVRDAQAMTGLLAVGWLCDRTETNDILG